MYALIEQLSVSSLHSSISGDHGKPIWKQALFCALYIVKSMHTIEQ